MNKPLSTYFFLVLPLSLSVNVWGTQYTLEKDSLNGVHRLSLQAKDNTLELSLNSNEFVRGAPYKVGSFRRSIDSQLRISFDLLQQVTQRELSKLRYKGANEHPHLFVGPRDSQFSKTDPHRTKLYINQQEVSPRSNNYGRVIEMVLDIASESTWECLDCVRIKKTKGAKWTFKKGANPWRNLSPSICREYGEFSQLCSFGQLGSIIITKDI